MIFLINLYRKVSFSTSKKCRFYPSCSSYAIQSIVKYGSFRGIFLFLKRLFKCNHFFSGGIDEVQ
ncbi:MAG: membrane protein insertion efficiency factor YidD [Firmicutes bacterium]|nr:membrane protein insertion efficiency factor YidD [Bacillota bacterium]